MQKHKTKTKQPKTHQTKPKQELANHSFYPWLKTPWQTSWFNFVFALPLQNKNYPPWLNPPMTVYCAEFMEKFKTLRTLNCRWTGTFQPQRAEDLQAQYFFLSLVCNGFHQRTAHPTPSLQSLSSLVILGSLAKGWRSCCSKRICLEWHPETLLSVPSSWRCHQEHVGDARRA